MRLSVIVPATDEPPTLERCLAAIDAADPPPDEVCVVRSPEGRGPAGARNDGVAATSGDILVFVDADVLVRGNVFERIQTALAADPGLVAVFGSYDDVPADHGFVSGFRNMLHHVVHQRSAGPASTFWAGLGAVKRDAFLACGGFDERRFPNSSIEDIELGQRLTAHGRIVLDPRLNGTHLKRWTLRSMVATDFERRSLPWLRLMLDQRRTHRVLNVGPREQASAGLALIAVVSTVLGRSRAALVAVAAHLLLNLDLYRALARRRGHTHAIVGSGLHLLHHLTAVAAVPVAVLTHLRGTRHGPRYDRRGSADDVGAE